MINIKNLFNKKVCPVDTETLNRAIPPKPPQLDKPDLANLTNRSIKIKPCNGKKPPIQDVGKIS